MKLGNVVAGIAVVASTQVAIAGGLFLPGSGAVSTSRAGASVASTSEAEAIGNNPAGLAKTKGTSITLSMAIINYAMEFTRRGTYDPIMEEALPFEGQAYPTVKNDSKPPLGIAGFQPIPVIGLVTDLGGAVPWLKLGAGLYAPNAYPFRDMCTMIDGRCQKYAFNGDFNVPPAPQRYDIVGQEGLVLLPSIAAAFSIGDKLDLGVRLSNGFAKVKSTVTIWGNLNNYEEYVKEDTLFTVEATDNFIPTFGLGVLVRPSPAIEIGAQYSHWLTVHGQGDATSEMGPNVSLNGESILVLPVDDSESRCATGGTREKQKACIELEVPMNATIGARYKFLDAAAKERGDIEFNVAWEHWGAARASDYRVVVDGDIYVRDANGDESYAISLRDNLVKHGFQDTFSFRLGGSYRAAIADNELIVRAGAAYDTAAAKTGWLRADVDGAARTTLALGAGLRTGRFEINLGGGAVLEGSPDNPGNCNPTGPQGTFGCGPNNTENPADDRQGPDPITPVLLDDKQAESPVTQGTYKAHYVMFMLGLSAWF